MQSIADSLIPFADKIFADITREIVGLDERGWVNNETHHSYQFPIELRYPFYGLSLLVRAKPIRLDDRDDVLQKCKEWRTDGLLNGSFSQKDFSITLDVVLHNDCLAIDEYRTLGHELLHAYQYALRKNNGDGKNLALPPLYIITIARYCQSESCRKFINLIYFIDRDEQDANIQMFYYEGKENPNIIRHPFESYVGKKMLRNKDFLNQITPLLDILDYDIIYCNEIWDCLNGEIVLLLRDCIDIGYSPKKLLKYCQRGYDRMYRKILRVCGRLNEEAQIATHSV